MKYAQRLVLSLCCLSVLNSCAALSKSEDAKAVVPPEKIYSIKHKEEGSIWPGETSGNMLFEDARGKQAGDLITILVVENATSTQTATTTTAKTSSLSMAVGSMLGLPSNLGIGSFLGSGNAFNPSVNGTTNNSNKGSGTTTRTGNLTATVTATIIEVLPSGNLKIEGKRIVTINNEDQILTVKGVVRPMDINFDNTISSTLIANAEILYDGKGVIADNQTVGWAARFLTWVWPF